MGELNAVITKAVGVQLSPKSTTLQVEQQIQALEKVLAKAVSQLK